MRPGPKRRWSRALWPALVLCALAASNTADAQLQIDNVPETIIEAFRTHLDRWSDVILGFAKKVFLVLGSIELTIALARSYYQEGGNFDRVMAVLLERMMFLGFWATLLFWGTPAIWNMIESFQRLGSSATGVDLNPTGIFEQGLTMTLDLMAMSFDEGILESTALFFPLTILAIVFMFATAEVVGALIDAYVIASAGIVVLGLGGSRWTSPIAQNYLRYALGAGIHLMVVNLVAAVGLKVLIDISAVIHGVGDKDATGLMAVVLYVTGAAILFAYLLRRVPATVSSIVSGAVSADSGGAVIAAAASGAHMGASAAMMTAAPAARLGLGAVGKVSTAVEAAAQRRQEGAPERLNAIVQANAAANPASQMSDMPPAPGISAEPTP